MSKETDKFIKDFKSTEKQLKLFSLAEAEKRKKAITAQLDKTWKVEDILQEAIQKARLSGVKGKKAADFIKLGPVAKELKTWQAALKLHTEGLKDFEDHCAEARTMQTALDKRVVAVEKDIKKSGGTGDIKLMATVKEARRALTDLEKTAKAFGTLQGHVVLYGAHLPRTIEAIVKTALDAVDPKEFPKAFEADNRKKTAKMLKDHKRKLDGLFKMADAELERGGEKMGKIFKAMDALLSDLEKLDAEGIKTEKTMKKEIKEAKDGKEIADLIKAVRKSHKIYATEAKALKKEAEELARAA